MRLSILISLSVSLISMLSGLCLDVKASPTAEQARHKLERARLEQSMKMIVTNTQSAGWEDSSRVPSDFPVRLFRGNQTQFMRMDALERGMADFKKHGRHLTMKTKDPASTVIQFFKTSLPSAGFKINEKYGTSSGNAYTLFAESEKMTVMVAAVPHDDVSGPACQFQVNVSYLPEPVKKKF